MMAEMIRVPEMTSEQQRVLRLLSPQEKLDILSEAALSRRKSIGRQRNQISFNGTTYEVYELDRIDLATQAMAQGKQVLVHRVCVSCGYDMYDAPPLRYQWSDTCSVCEVAFEEQQRSEEESRAAAQQRYYDQREWDDEQHRMAQEEVNDR